MANSFEFSQICVMANSVEFAQISVKFLSRPRRGHLSLISTGVNLADHQLKSTFLDHWPISSFILSCLYLWSGLILWLGPNLLNLWPKKVCINFHPGPINLDLQPKSTLLKPWSESTFGIGRSILAFDPRQSYSIYGPSRRCYFYEFTKVL